MTPTQYRLCVDVCVFFFFFGLLFLFLPGDDSVNFPLQEKVFAPDSISVEQYAYCYELINIHKCV